MKKKKKNGLTIKKIFKEAGATNMKKKEEYYEHEINQAAAVK